MNPLICFYKDDLYFQAMEYQVIECDLNENEFDFLEKIETQYYNEVKILQMNFEAFTKFKKSSPIRVYVLKHYELVHKDQFLTEKKFNIEFQSNMSSEVFKDKIKLIKKDISQGRYYQINLTSSLSGKKSSDINSFDLFKFYFQKFKSNYSCLLPYKKDSDILCYSPELFLEKNGSLLKTQPIKGTSDDKNTAYLIASEKENAELSMIVDLLRNDLQSVCEKPVTVSHHRSLLNLGYITHTYSEIQGYSSKSTSYILKNILPGGSISGCPKTESLEAIHQLEPVARNFYTGCIGWWIKSDLKLNLTIRCFLNEAEKITYYTGCGVVYDSEPENEWAEFLNKSSLLKINL